MENNGNLQWSLFLPTMDYASAILVGYSISESKLYKSFSIQRNEHGNLLNFYDAADYGHHFSRADCPKLGDIVPGDEQHLIRKALAYEQPYARNYSEDPYWWDHKEQYWRKFRKLDPLAVCDMKYPEDLNVK